MSDLDKLTDQIEGTAATPEPDAAPEPEIEASDPELEAEARKYGWKPKDEFTLDQKGFVPADRFLNLASTKFKRERDANRELREQMARIEGVTTAALQRVRDQERQAFEARLAQVRNEQRLAVESADTAAFDHARQREAQLMRSAPEPVPVPQPALPKWADDPDLRAFGAQAIDDAPGIKSLPFAKQVEWAEKRVREVFPEKFPEPVEKAAPTRSRVDGGGLAGGVRRERGPEDLPPEVRKIGEGFVKDKIFDNIGAYAKEYFKQNGV